jgi:hypothetical protein
MPPTPFQIYQLRGAPGEDLLFHIVILHALMMTVEDSAFVSPRQSTVDPSPCSPCLRFSISAERK